MFALRNLQRQLLNKLSYLSHTNFSNRDATFLTDVSTNLVSANAVTNWIDDTLCRRRLSLFGGVRAMSTVRGRTMRSKVEMRMQRESGKTLREVRRAKKLRKKLMTVEERLIYNLRRAKKKVTLLLQKLKKYELPDLPLPCHDPELLTPEQLQAFKKIGYRNKNYCPVGVRGVFGGVILNMHLHWKFHETVQVCCDNVPKEKIKEMATLLARLSGGIVIDIHKGTTIIMFRGRNYRQPKILTPINTLTKRKALFKARFEQALESQKLNIKSYEQKLRRMGVNPEDPVAMASIQRVASTFFNAIDKKDGSPYVFNEDRKSVTERDNKNNYLEAGPNDDDSDSDQEELDKFIAEIEEAADKEWAEEEDAETDEFQKMRYWNREDFSGRIRDELDGRVRRPEWYFDHKSNETRGARSWQDRHASNYDDRGGQNFKDRRASDEDNRGGRDFKDERQRINDSDDEENGDEDNEWDTKDVGHDSDVEKDGGDYNVSSGDFDKPRKERGAQGNDKISKAGNTEGFKRNRRVNNWAKTAKAESESEDKLSDLENVMWKSEGEEDGDPHASKAIHSSSGPSSDEDEEKDFQFTGTGRNRGNQANQNITMKANDHGDFKKNSERNTAKDYFGSECVFSDSKMDILESDDDDWKSLRAANYDYMGSGGEEEEKGDTNHKNTHKDGGYNNKMKSQKRQDEYWDSD